MNIILGTLNFDYDCVSEVFTQAKVKEMLRLAKQSGINTIDTAYYYGQSETLLGNTNLMHLFNINSKANPWYNNDFTNGRLGQLNKNGVQHQLNSSLKALQIDSLNTYFMHCWDYDTQVKETLEIFDEYYRKDKFKYFGVSNISVNQLNTIINLCDTAALNISPDVYQGMYNIYCRAVEEVFPLLNDHRIRFECYNPLAGGLLTGKYYNSNIEKGRFINNSIYQSIFWNTEVVNNSKNINADMALRWLSKHSKLKSTDSIIIGCSSAEHLTSNVSSILNTQPLTCEQLSIIDAFYDLSKRFQPNYFY